MTVNIALPNGKNESVDSGVSPFDLLEAAEVSKKKVVAAKFNGEIVELNRPLNEDGNLEYIRISKEPDALHVLRHTTAHVMAQAVSRLFDNVEFAI